MIGSVTEFYCECHFSANASGNLRAFVFAIFIVNVIVSSTGVQKHLPLPLYGLSNLIFYSSRLLSILSVRALYMVPVLSPPIPGSMPVTGLLKI
jgi:hypothetical protein